MTLDSNAFGASPNSAEEGEAIDLSVVIPNWNGRGVVERCISTLLADVQSAHRRRIEVIVVDNGSTDDSAMNLRQEWPAIHTLFMSTNQGFSRACNVGIAASSGRYVLLLNSDVEILPGFVEGSLAFLDANQRAGLANPMVLWPDGTPQPSLLRAPTFASALWEEIFWHTRLHVWAKSDYRARATIEGMDYSQPMPMDFLRGSCLFIRREVLDSVGLLDDRFFFGHEELDYCQRVAKAGWELIWIGQQSQVIHRASEAGHSFGRELVLWTNDSKFRYWGKRRGPAAEGLLRILVASLAAAKWFAHRAREPIHDGGDGRERAALEARIIRSSLIHSVGLPEAEGRRRVGIPSGASHDFIVPLIATNESVVDIGCGSGHLLAALRDVGVKCLAGVEGSFLRAEEAAKAAPEAAIVCADLDSLPPFANLRSFDTAIIADVVEHLKGGDQLLRWLSTPVARGGGGVRRLVTSIPNVAYWRVRLMLAKGVWRYEDTGILDRTHLRFFTLAAARMTIRDTGWVIGRMYAVPGNKTLGARGSLSRLAAFLVPGLFGYQFIFDCYAADPSEVLDQPRQTPIGGLAPTSSSDGET